ncbi:hypothetical protein EK21DRAFT_114081 [Setomelanomma holmii]|uniref:Uncharacterized protein n=1 Tax=Setomelanomma holmii TaxID=210430 RepID=A0A9P4H7N4_9PLEO|nr:hypothetical protein EK21DRAFT_114081 [Setomelanomma holmii]
MSPPTFLSLPREIRNLVYDYLTHEVVVDWGYRIFPFPLGGHSAVRIRVPEAPLISALLSCTQIHDEYSQARHVQLPSVAIDLSEECIWRLMEGQPTNQGRAFKILERVGRVEFSVKCIDGMTFNQDLWNLEELFVSAEALTQAMSVFAPKLKTIQVNFDAESPSTLTEVAFDFEDGINLSWTSWLSAINTPPLLAGRFVLERDLVESMRLLTELYVRDMVAVTNQRRGRLATDERTRLCEAQWRLMAGMKSNFG